MLKGSKHATLKTLQWNVTRQLVLAKSLKMKLKSLSMISLLVF